MQLAAFFDRALDLIFPLGDTARIVRDTSSEAFLALLSPQVTPTGATALLPYRHRMVRAVIREAKFHRNPKAISLLGNALAEYLTAVEEEQALFVPSRVAIVPVPLGGGRRKERGYNQVEEIARAARIPLDMLLARTRETLPQTTLSRRERLRNMDGAFRAAGPAERNTSYIVLDDVITTGATLAAAAEALRYARASEVRMLALAH